MILDTIENIGRYDLPQEAFGDLKRFLGKINEWEFSQGKFEIKGEELFGIGLEYETKVEEDCLWEAHRKYIDIHLLLEGEEMVHISNLGDMQTTKVYDEEGDYALYDGSKQYEVCLKKGDFLVLYPEEVHKTSVVFKTPKKVRKNVFKLRLA